MNKQERLLRYIIAFFLTVSTGVAFAQQAENSSGGTKTTRIKGELGLTEAQASKLAQVVLSGQKEMDSLRMQSGLSVEERRKLLEEAGARKQQAIRSLLTAEQRAAMGNQLEQRSAGRSPELPDRDKLRAQVLERLQKAGNGHAFKSMKQIVSDTLQKRNNKD